MSESGSAFATTSHLEATEHLAVPLPSGATAHLDARTHPAATVHVATDPAGPSQRSHVFSGSAVLPTLSDRAHSHDLDALARQLADLQAWLADDLAAVERALRTPTGSTLAERAGRHLLQAGGKRIRPLCTLLVGRMGAASDGSVPAGLRDLAIAVELVHNATLLHDDVVDMADTRRGQPTSRALHGNEVSIFAGDWVLVAALRRIVASGYPHLVGSALDTLEAMIAAEVEQAQRASVLADDVEGYLRVAQGKTASLFRWAMQAGATAAGLDCAATAALQTFGGDLGIAFQITDDVLDLCGQPQHTGKALFADICEGKITLPVAFALHRQPDLREQILTCKQTHLAEQSGTPVVQNRADCSVADQCAGIVAAVVDCGALEAAREQASHYCERALASLLLVRPCPEVDALRTVADALVRRRA
ncbi:MAG: polyprenyl synthetase family protein [Myxococcales bacterium]|nr:polyprenyl synthetase family protein [Myxococcales bacterium]